jgi:hypothetical protein
MALPAPCSDSLMVDLLTKFGLPDLGRFARSLAPTTSDSSASRPRF